MTTGARRFTVDDMRAAPDWGLRREVLDGRLILTPPQPRQHDRVVGNLAGRFWQSVPRGNLVRGGCAVGLPDGDGPVPDLLVSATAARPELAVVPAREVFTVVEVVSADGRHIDRVWKRDRYAEAGIPCYWRVELEPWPGYRGALPVIVVRLREGSGWRDVLAPAGRLHTLPVAYGRGPGGEARTVPVRVDPMSLTVRHATAW